MKIINGIPVFGDVEQSAIDQMAVCLRNEYAVKGALCADAHKGYSLPIGGVIAFNGAISPSCVGYDISCGNKAVKLDIDPSYVIKNISSIMDSVQKAVSFGVGQKNSTKVDCPLFDADIWNRQSLRGLKDMAMDQLGTGGSSNHYADIFLSDDNYIWVGVHFGSRGLGYKIAEYYLSAGGAKDGMDVEPLVLPVSSDLGSNYLIDMSIAGEYAYAGRDWACSKIAEIIGGNIIEEVHNHHNFAWLENHGGEKLWVVRKGATPAFNGQKGFIGATMFEKSVIIEGTENELCAKALYSTVHGAGRVMGRAEAKGKIDKKTKEIKRKGRVTKEMMGEWLVSSGVELRGGDVDESPHCYKRLDEVLAHHGDTIKIIRTLKPLGVCMASKTAVDIPS